MGEMLELYGMQSDLKRSGIQVRSSKLCPLFFLHFTNKKCFMKYQKDFIFHLKILFEKYSIFYDFPSSSATFLFQSEVNK